MALSTQVKNTVNSFLSRINVRIDTLTAERAESDRIRRQVAAGQFNKPVFPLLEGMERFEATTLESAYAMFHNEVDRMMDGALPGKLDRSNSFYTSPDAEILYLLVRSLEPKRIVEVGSGNSTRIIRQAISDGDLLVEHTAIDPEPRADINGLTTHLLRQRYEDTNIAETLATLDHDDVLFIDSSHLVHIANDVAKLFCNTLPALKSGVVVHVHDVFLPFDYPIPLCTKFSDWGEQYLLQVMLSAKPREILWPGYYVQQLRPELHNRLPFLSKGRAQSFWFRM